MQDIIKTITGVENLIVHNHCLQFRIKIKDPNHRDHNNTFNNNINNNENETNATTFSDLFNKLYLLTVGRGIFYTITECLLDQVIKLHNIEVRFFG